MEECKYYFRCKNNEKCFRCFNESLLKLPENKTTNKNFNYKDANKKNSWEDLEETVANELNNVPTIKEARRSRASGALWFEKGDVLDSILNVECKERKGNELKGGDKSISIKKTWLTKAKEEAMDNDRIMVLPFRFKGDEDYYMIVEPITIIDVVNIAKAYMNENAILEKENETLKQALSKYSNKE